jgi:hypothetical protein
MTMHHAMPKSVRALQDIVALATFAMLPITLSGCSEDALPEFGSPLYEGDDFDVWASDGLVACEGTFPYTEAWLSAFRRRVSENGSPTHHRFYWLGPEDADKSPCSSGWFGCAYPSEPSNPIYSSLIPFEHEIVHVEIDAKTGHPLLREGAAELFGSISGPTTTSIVPIRDMVGGDVPGYGYQSAGRFSRYLVEAHGLEAYETLLATTGGRDESSLDAAFREVLEVSLDDAISDYETFSPCATPHWRYYDYECGDLAVSPWIEPGLWQDTIALSCDQPDVIGPRGAEPTVWTLRALEVDATGSFELSIASNEPATVSLASCSGNCFDEDGVSPPLVGATTEQSSGTVLLFPGRYWLHVAHDASSSADVTIQLRSLGE